MLPAPIPCFCLKEHKAHCFRQTSPSSEYLPVFEVNLGESLAREAGNQEPGCFLAACRGSVQGAAGMREQQPPW